MAYGTRWVIQGQNPETGDTWKACAYPYCFSSDVNLSIGAVFDGTNTTLTVDFPDRSEIGPSGKFAIYRNPANEVNYQNVGEYVRDPDFFICCDDLSDICSEPVVTTGGLYESLYESLYE